MFVDRSALFGGYFDSLGIREEAKKEWDLKESQMSETDLKEEEESFPMLD